MKKSKLITLYETLSSSQLESLRKWINSPIHNKHKDVILLFEQLLAKQKLTERTIEKEIIWRAIYFQKKYQDLRMRHLMSLSVGVLEEFIAYLGRKNETFDNTLTLAEYCTEKGLDKYAGQYLKRVQKTQKKVKQKNSFFYFQQYQLEQAIFDTQDAENSVVNANLQAIFDNHSCAFVIETLRYACVVVTDAKNANKSYNIPLLTAIIREVESGKYDNSIAVQLYYNSYKMLVLPTVERYFYTLKELLFEYKNTLPPVEIKDVYLVAINYCIKYFNREKEEYVQVLFDLFQYGLEQQILIVEEQLNKFTYQKILITAIKLKKYQWVALFIDKYTRFLDKKNQDKYLLFAKANLAFAQDSFEQTTSLLLGVDFDDLLLNISAKLILTKLYYQQKNWEQLEIVSSDFYLLLADSNLTNYHKINYQNILEYIKIMVVVFDKEEISKLEEKIKSTKLLTEKKWFLEQLAIKKQININE